MTDALDLAANKKPVCGYCAGTGKDPRFGDCGGCDGTGVSPLIRTPLPQWKLEEFDQLRGEVASLKAERDDLAVRASLVDEAEFANSTLVRLLSNRNETIVALQAERDALKAERDEARREAATWAAEALKQVGEIKTGNAALQAKLAVAEKALENIAELTAGQLSFGDQVFVVASSRSALATIRQPSQGETT